MKVIILAGMPGSGKDEFIKVGIKMGLSVIKMGDLVREEMKKRNLTINAQTIGEFASKERHDHDPGIWAKRVLDKVTEKNTIIEGIRGEAELNIFKHHFAGILEVVAIYSSPNTRYQRILDRDRNDDPDFIDELVKRDRRELDYGLGNIITMSDKLIINEGSIEEFQQQAERILRSILRDED